MRQRPVDAEEFDDAMCGGCDDDYLDGENDDYVYGVDDGRGGGDGDGEDDAVEDTVGKTTGGSGGQRHVRDCPGKRRRLATVTRWDASARAVMVRELSEGVT